jgi:hypothetical protein
MGKIQKDRSDSEMFANWQEDSSFENMADGQTESHPIQRGAKSDEKGVQSFFTPELKEEIGKALLELKVNLYKQGIVDFKLTTTVKDQQIILTATPKKALKNKDSRF